MPWWRPGRAVRRRRRAALGQEDLLRLPRPVRLPGRGARRPDLLGCVGRADRIGAACAPETIPRHTELAAALRDRAVQLFVGPPHEGRNLAPSFWSRPLDR